MKIIIINGPNLNLLGIREPAIYGKEPFEKYFDKVKSKYPDVELEYFQSNVEGEIINKLHESDMGSDGIILNPGGYTHTSVSIGDAVAAIQTRVVEVHISNTFAREEFRRHSYISPNAHGIITGFGMEGYELAILSFFNLK